jgi:hypothetical protein
LPLLFHFAGFTQPGSHRSRAAEMLLLFRSIHKEFASQRWEQQRAQAKTATLVRQHAIDVLAPPNAPLL